MSLVRTAGWSGLACLVIGVTGVGHAVAASCDRGCLEGFAGDYVAAMMKHDAAGLPVAPGLVATQNGAPFKLGDGVWQTITAVQSQPQFVADVDAQQIGYIGLIQDGDRPAFFGLRLKIVDRRITEVETMLSHDGEAGPAFLPQGFVYREAPYIRDVPQPNRSSRDDLLRIANGYWDIATSTHDGGAVPYAPDCWHFENGMNTDWERKFFPNELSNPGAPEKQPQADGRIWTCAREVYLTTKPWVATHDRHFLVDAERGLVLNMVLVDVKGRPRPPGPAPAPPPDGREKPINGPGLLPLGLSKAGMAAVMGKTYTALHFEVMRIVGGKITREQDIVHAPAA